MVLAFVALAASMQVAAPAPGPASEVVVMGQKLKNWRASVRDRNGRVDCKVKVSSGDKEIDAVGCQAMTTCMAQMRPRLPSTIDKSLSAAEREANNQSLNRDLTACVKTNHDTGLAALAERRYQARQGARR
ncbi:hypothetical protein GCM10022281_09510 [Sphingomonas rosea]|uniref:UrcA family protein n=1 Tax=Sphingomonas rosea TaxID=335605 RepID=A0ABP7TXG0_9SPHN